MSLIVDPLLYEAWLCASLSRKSAALFFETPLRMAFEVLPVSKGVNSPKNNYPDLMDAPLT